MKEKNPQRITDKYIARDGGPPGAIAEAPKNTNEISYAEAAWRTNADKIRNCLRSERSKKFILAAECFEEVGFAIGRDSGKAFVGKARR
ncbi:MAG: hypothetical protein KGZ68_10960 [Dechloromonas sp.]|nr:hypothetical protein [Dechloromonas sp.]